MSDRVRCPACGTANAADDAYCGTCGSPLTYGTVPPVPCWSCGAANLPGRAYCRSCGQSLSLIHI
jgi:uncharacterized OB-fold protein